jgi:hypothetical protein
LTEGGLTSEETSDKISFSASTTQNYPDEGIGKTRCKNACHEDSVDQRKPIYIHPDKSKNVIQYRQDDFPYTTPIIISAG